MISPGPGLAKCNPLIQSLHSAPPAERGANRCCSASSATGCQQQCGLLLACRYNTFNVQAGTLFCDAAYQREARPSLPVKTLSANPET